MDIFDAQPPVRKQSVCHHRKKDHSQFPGTPPFSVSQSDKVLPILTACFWYVKKEVIQDKRTG